MKLQAVLSAACLVSWLAQGMPAFPQSTRTSPPGAPPGGQVVLVFDLDGMSAGGLQRARSAAAAFIRGGLPEGTAAGIVAGDKLVGNRLTSNRDELLRALASLRVSGDAIARQGDVPLDRGDERAAEIAAMLDAGNRTPAVSAEARSRRTLGILQALTKTLAPLPGSKTIAWISESFSGASRDREKLRGHEAQARALVAAAEQASIRMVAIAPSPGAPVLSGDDLWQELVKATKGAFASTDQRLEEVVRPAEVPPPAAPAPAMPAAAPVTAPPGTAPPDTTPPPPVPPDAPVAARTGAVPLAPGGSPTSTSPRVPRLVVPKGVEDPGLGARAGDDDNRLPPELQAQARAGWDAYQAGDTKLALERLSPAAASADAPAWVNYVLGWAEFAEGNVDNAREQWTRVRKAVPDFEQVYFDLVDCSLRDRQPLDALSILRDAQKRFPASSEVLNAIGSIQTSLGRLDEALAAFEGAVQRAPDDPIGHFNIAKAVELRYVRRFRGEDRSRPPDPADLERAAAEYRRATAVPGPMSKEAVEGYRRTAQLDVKPLDPGVPALVGSYTEAALGGFPVRLAWSPDGTYLCIGAVSTDKAGKVVSRPLRVVTAWSGELNTATAPPDWAAAYWRWKSAFSPPFCDGPGSRKVASAPTRCTTVGRPARRGADLPAGRRGGWPGRAGRKLPFDRRQPLTAGHRTRWARWPTSTGAACSRSSTAACRSSTSWGGRVRSRFPRGHPTARASLTCRRRGGGSSSSSWRFIPRSSRRTG